MKFEALFNSQKIWLLPVLAALVAFSPILWGEFVYDDIVLLKDNPAMSSWSIMWECWTQPMWELVEDTRNHTGGFYRPIGTISFSLLWHLGQGSPFTFHLASWLLNAICAGLIASLVFQFNGQRKTAIFAGLIFAVHGAHVESVAWASSLTYLIACSFSLLALRAVINANFGKSAFFIGLALLAQESASGAFVLCSALCLLHPHNEGIEKRLQSFAPLALSLIAVWLLRVVAFDSFAAGLDRRLTWFGLELRQYPLLEEFALSLHMLFDYLRFLIFPWPHAPFNPLRVSLGVQDIDRWLPAVLGLVAAFICGIFWLKRALNLVNFKHSSDYSVNLVNLNNGRDYSVLLGLGLIFAGLAPVMKTSSLGQFPFEERFLYLPSAGFAIFIAGIIPKRFSSLLSFVVVLNAGSVFSTIGHWKNENTLFAWAREVSPNTMMSWNESGRILLNQAQALPEGELERLKLAAQAEKYFATGLELNPDDWFISAIDRHNGNVGLANSILVAGDYETALSTFEKIIERWPNSAEANSGLAFCLVQLADQELELGMETEAFDKLNSAIKHFDVALSQTTHMIEVSYGKGRSLFLLNKFEESIPWLEQAFNTNHGDFRFAYHLASAYFETQHLLFAQQTYEKFLMAAPNNPYAEEIKQTIRFIIGERNKQSQ